MMCHSSYNHANARYYEGYAVPFVRLRPSSSSTWSFSFPVRGASFSLIFSPWLVRIPFTLVLWLLRRRRRLCLRLLCDFSSTSSGNSMPASLRIRWTTGPIANSPSCRSWLQQGLYLIGRSQSYQWSPKTDLKFLYGPRSNGFSPGLVYKMANVRAPSEGWSACEFDPSDVVSAEYEIVRKPGFASGNLGMYIASVQTIVLRERFSMVVVFTIANCRELPVIPAVKRPKRAPLWYDQ